MLFFDDSPETFLLREEEVAADFVVPSWLLKDLLREELAALVFDEVLLSVPTPEIDRLRPYVTALSEDEE